MFQPLILARVCQLINSILKMTVHLLYSLYKKGVINLLLFPSARLEDAQSGSEGTSRARHRLREDLRPC